MTTTPTRKAAPAKRSGAARKPSAAQKTAGKRATAVRAAGPALTAADRAYDRRRRRTQRMTDPRLTRVGSPIRDRVARIPFVIVVIILLAIGGVSVLYLNTRTDETGMLTNESHQRSDELRLEIESLERDVAALDATPEIAKKAKEMGLVQAGDPAIIKIDKDGNAEVIGEPHPAGSDASAPASEANGGGE